MNDLTFWALVLLGLAAAGTLFYIGIIRPRQPKSKKTAKPNSRSAAEEFVRDLQLQGKLPSGRLEVVTHSPMTDDKVSDEERLASAEKLLKDLGFPPGTSN